MIGGPKWEQRDGAPEVEVRGLTKEFVRGGVDGGRLVAVDGVDLSLVPGELVALTGPSGSGKSTLLHMLGGLERPDGGTLTVRGVDLSGASPRVLAAHRRRTGFVYQRFHLLPALTSLDNVCAPLLPYRNLPFDRVARARQLLAAVGLEGREGSLPSRLSGGQQQRVAIARALVGAPGLLLADEPTGNLDQGTGKEIVELLMRMREEQGITVVISTHDPVLAALCERRIRLLDGRMMPEGD
ncbi:ABC transporter ATP-binding protein [Streptomyces sp. NPDC093064]|uniref:ABC transporter ATP-binding protein n=1 Tax=Streptomyces sp. NPDC093064 TaxID=3366020 RepID=UPI00381ED4DF